MSDDLISSSPVDLLMGTQLLPHCCSSEPLGLANWRLLGSAGLELGVYGLFDCLLAYSQLGGFGMVTGHMCLT